MKNYAETEDEISFERFRYDGFFAGSFVIPVAASRCNFLVAKREQNILA
jgi:hypothetical protein